MNIYNTYLNQHIEDCSTDCWKSSFAITGINYFKIQKKVILNDIL